MQHQDGLNLRREWGEQPCKHESLEPEFFEKTPTGDYLCKECGKVFEAWQVEGLFRKDDNSKSTESNI